MVISCHSSPHGSVRSTCPCRSSTSCCSSMYSAFKRYTSSLSTLTSSSLPTLPSAPGVGHLCCSDSSTCAPRRGAAATRCAACVRTSRDTATVSLASLQSTARHSRFSSCSLTPGCAFRYDGAVQPIVSHACRLRHRQQLGQGLELAQGKVPVPGHLGKVAVD